MEIRTPESVQTKGKRVDLEALSSVEALLWKLVEVNLI